MKLENDRLCVEIAEQGAEVTRIYDKKATQSFCGRLIRNTGKGILRSCFRMWERHTAIPCGSTGSSTRLPSMVLRGTISSNVSGR